MKKSHDFPIQAATSGDERSLLIMINSASEYLPSIAACGVAGWGGRVLGFNTTRVLKKNNIILSLYRNR